jgi:hypothetical protein
MNKRPGHIKVTTEPGYCSFCDRTRNLRREEHQLGTFVRTVVTCETCHRTLSSTMGVASAEAPVSERAPDVETPATAKATPASSAQPAKRTVATTAPAASPKPKATKARTTRTK